MERALFPYSTPSISLAHDHDHDGRAISLAARPAHRNARRGPQPPRAHRRPALLRRLPPPARAHRLLHRAPIPHRARRRRARRRPARRHRRAALDPRAARGAARAPRGMAPRRLVVDDLGVRIKDFALDPAQDLIVLLEHQGGLGPFPALSASGAPGAEVRVHLRRLGGRLGDGGAEGLAARAPHPRARCAVLCRRAPGPIHGCMIQIVEDVVGMYFWQPFHGVLIWNWVTGEELVFFQEDQAPERIWDFSFLSARAYMVTTLKDGGEIRIYSFPGAAAAGGLPTHVATLHLPAPHRSRVLLELTTTTGPFLAGPPAGAPFAAARGARVHVFTLHHDPAAHRGRWQPACIVVHNHTLMRYVEAFDAGADAGAGAADVPWDAWGPQGTRFFVLAMGFQWLRYVHGTRVVCPVLQPSGERRVEVLDFNAHAGRPPRAAEAEAEAEAAPPGAQCVREASVFPAGELFAEDVVSALPYYAVPAPDEQYVGYMIDEGRLLGLKASPFIDGDLGDVDVYTF
ncbi:hypothetical protein BC834DRAFT_304707 [Gloeopeniophorella convolvens]|nr:hypothetical protein BC834DRAFT_304707 [Gloeopeniophorella convolvens]